MDQELKGKRALVTGASRGIGAATAIALARAGAGHLIIQYNSYREGAERVVAATAELGVPTEALQADLGERSGIHDFVHRLRGREFDIVVNNAGSLVHRAPLVEVSEDLYDRVMNLNVKSAWMITQEVAPAMIARGSGVIVFVASIAGRNGGGPGSIPYAAAKAAVSGMTRGIARELAPKGIRVNAVSPGTVDNYFHEQFSTREGLKAVAAATPAGRLGTNEELADAILFLCSAASRYIYGQTIEVNGGSLMA